MKDIADTTSEFERFCCLHEMKRTAQRFAVFEAVFGNRTHPTVDEIFALVKSRIPTIKQESVYRILSDFKKAGLVSKMSLPGSMRYDSNSLPHGHFVCSCCGKIADLDISEKNLPVRDFLKGCTELSVTIGGLCPSCSKKRKFRKRLIG